MKITKAGIVAAALLVGSTAHAEQYTFDYEGFTVEFTGSSAWGRPIGGHSNTGILDDIGAYDWTPGTGAQVSSTWFNLPTTVAPAISASGADATAVARSNFTYSIQTKPGWQLSAVSLQGYQWGSYTESQSGTASIFATGFATSNAGWYMSNYIGSSKNPPSSNWAVVFDELLLGNAIECADTCADILGLPLIGHPYVFKQYSEDVTEVSGHAEIEFRVSAGSTFGSASITSLPAELSLGISAFKPIVSPVPEPEPYVMMTASLGVIGFLLRRRSRKIPLNPIPD